MKKSVVVSFYQNVEFPTDCEHTVTTLIGNPNWDASCNVRKPVIGVSAEISLKPVCSAIETS